MMYYKLFNFYDDLAITGDYVVKLKDKKFNRIHQSSTYYTFILYKIDNTNEFDPTTAYKLPELMKLPFNRTQFNKKRVSNVILQETAIFFSYIINYFNDLKPILDFDRESLYYLDTYLNKNLNMINVTIFSRELFKRYALKDSKANQFKVYLDRKVLHII